MGISLEVWGAYGLFTRPEMKVERVSYDVITPSAARGLIEAIYWHPGLVWRIDSIKVCNPIRFFNIRRNELKHKISVQSASTAKKNNTDFYLNAKNDIAQRASLVLKNIRYIIDAHFDLTERATSEDNDGKFADIIRRRIEKGQCFHQPYFGCREFPANFKPFNGTYECPQELKGEKDLGWMLYDFDFSNDIQPMFFRATLKDGVLQIPRYDSDEVKR